jgi:hypothetical protein
MPVSADLVRLAEVPETVYGTTPATPAFKVLRYTGESLSFAPTTALSAGMNPQRSVEDSILTGGSVTGTVNYELAKEVWYEDFLSGAMCSDWATNVLKVGTLRKSFTVEKTLPVTTGVSDYHRIPGSIINGFTLTIAPNAIVTGTFDILGKSYDTEAAIVTGATYVSPALRPVFTAPLVTDIVIEGVPATGKCFTSMVLTLNNNYRALECIGTLGARDMSMGRCEITFAFSLYYSDASLLDYLTAQTELDISFTLTDAATPPNTYHYALHRAKLTQCNVVAGGTGTDVLAECVATALLDTTQGTPLTITRAPGAATLGVEVAGTEAYPAVAEEVAA